MSSFNKVILLGRLAADPERKVSNSGTAVTKFRMATGDGTDRDPTQWHNIVCFGKTADLVGQYMKKGRQLLLEGRIQYSKVPDKTGSGQERWFTDIIADRVTFVSEGRSQGEGNSHGFGDRSSDFPAPSQDVPGFGDSAPQQAPSAPPPDDDIPF